MAKRQFSKTDTSKWEERYGSRSDGVKSVASNSSYDGANAGLSAPALAGQKNVGLDNVSTFQNGDLVLIHQSRGANAGMWELNKIASGGGTNVLVMKYDLCNSYSESGANQAQVLEMKEYKSFNVANGITFSTPAWDGNKGGITAFFVNGNATTTGTGVISANSAGYRGASAVRNADGKRGEGYGSTTYNDTSNSSNFSGGGGGWTGDNHGGFGGGGGGGGGHASSGSGGGSAGTQGIGGSGGLIGIDTSDLSIAHFGGGGASGGEQYDQGNSGPGGPGGGFVLIIAKKFNGLIVANGSVGSNTSSPGDSGGGGGGAGGSICVKGSSVTLSSSTTATGGSGGTGAGSGASGGTASTGRIAVYVPVTSRASGSTTPSKTVVADSILRDVAGGAALLMQLK